ncbi:hypothetical protein JCM16303_005231 [Sporobolomyces ruberrimus]
MIPAESRHSTTLAQSIDRAFDRATGYDAGAQPPDQNEEPQVVARRRRKGKARAVIVSEDEEEEEGSAPARVSTDARSSHEAPAVLEPAGSAPSYPPTGGGFLPMELDQDDYGAAPPPQPQGPPTSIPAAPAPGGFLVEGPDASSLSPFNQELEPARSLGGFFPSLISDSDAFALPTPPRPGRIALSRIPAALRELGVPRGSDRDIMELFEEVAEEDLEGYRSVQREKFVEALEVLLGEEDFEDTTEILTGDAAEKAGTVATAGQSLRMTRMSTRANPSESSQQMAEARRDRAKIEEQDFADDGLSSGSEVSADFSTDEGEMEERRPASVRKAPKTTSKAHKKRAKYDPRSSLSRETISGASDTFDLFFGGSPQLALPRKDRAIGLAELQRACRDLKERISDEELIEMLEFAAGANSPVKLDHFARILVELRL